jgi:hypothetical protein
MDVWFKINETYFKGSDIDNEGHYVHWSVDLWEYTNFLKIDTIVLRKTFKTKVEAQEFIKNRQDQLLVCIIKVDRKTYDCKKDHPCHPSVKRMYEWHDH